MGYEADITMGRSIDLERDFINNFIDTLKDFWKMIEDQYLELL